MAGVAVVDGKRIVWPGNLPEGTSAQKAELIALTKALQMAEGQSINIYTNSR
jgi:ribonuclease HI